MFANTIMFNNNSDSYPRNFDLGEILSISKNFYVANFSKLFVIAFICYIPVNLFLYKLNVADLVNENILLDHKINLIMRIIAGILLNSIATVALSIYLNLRLESTNVTAGDVFKEFYLRLVNNFILNVFGYLLLYILITSWFILGFVYPYIFIFIFIPSIIVFVFASFTFYAFAADDINIFKAIRYSTLAVLGRWGRVFLYSLTITILNTITILFLSTLTSFLSLGNFRLLIDTLMSALTSYFIIVYAVFYLNLKHTSKILNDDQFKFLR